MDGRKDGPITVGRRTVPLWNSSTGAKTMAILNENKLKCEQSEQILP